MQMRHPYDDFFMLRLKGLDPAKVYVDQESGKKYSGAYLMNAGLNLTYKPNGDGASYRVHLIAE